MKYSKFNNDHDLKTKKRHAQIAAEYQDPVTRHLAIEKINRLKTPNAIHKTLASKGFSKEFIDEMLSHRTTMWPCTYDINSWTTPEAIEKARQIKERTAANRKAKRERENSLSMEDVIEIQRKNCETLRLHAARNNRSLFDYWAKKFGIREDEREDFWMDGQRSARKQAVDDALTALDAATNIPKDNSQNSRNKRRDWLMTLTYINKSTENTYNLDPVIDPMDPTGPRSSNLKEAVKFLNSIDRGLVLFMSDYYYAIDFASPLWDACRYAKSMIEDGPISTERKPYEIPAATNIRAQEIAKLRNKKEPKRKKKRFSILDSYPTVK